MRRADIKRVHLTMMMHPDTIATIERLRGMTSTSRGRVVDDAIKAYAKAIDEAMSNIKIAV